MEQRYECCCIRKMWLPDGLPEQSSDSDSTHLMLDYCQWEKYSWNNCDVVAHHVVQDLISEVTCKEPYEWKDPTEDEWEFSPSVMSGNGAEPFKVGCLALSLYCRC